MSSSPPWPAWRPAHSSNSATSTACAPEHRYAAWQDLVAHGELDVVSIATPTALHAPIAICCARRRPARPLGEADGREQRGRPNDGGGGPPQRPRARRLVQPPPPRRRAGAEEDHRRRVARPHLLREGGLAATRGDPRARQLVHPGGDRRGWTADGHRRAHARHGLAPARRTDGHSGHRGDLRRIRAAGQGRLAVRFHRQDRGRGVGVRRGGPVHGVPPAGRRAARS